MNMTILACLAAVPLAAAGVEPAARASPKSIEPSLQESLRVTSAERAPLNLLLTQAELRSVVRSYEERTGEILTSPLGDDAEIVVTAPGERAPMRDRSQDVMGGIAAPFWALAHPKDAWRIFVPIPPKGTRVDDRPAPDPR